MAHLRSAGQRRGTRRPWPLAAIPETFLVEGRPAAKHVINSPSQPSRQDGHGLAVATLGGLLVLPLLGSRTLPQEQAGRLGKGPTQMGVADLLAACAQLLAGRLVSATHQSSV